MEQKIITKAIELKKKGKTNVYIAKELNIHPSSVSDIMWKHFPKLWRPNISTPQVDWDWLLEESKKLDYSFEQNNSHKRSFNKSKILKRDNHKCRKCGNIDRLEIHHIIPLIYGGTDDCRNLITLCRTCHKEIPEKDITKAMSFVSTGLPPRVDYFFNCGFAFLNEMLKENESYTIKDILYKFSELKEKVKCKIGKKDD